MKNITALFGSFFSYNTFNFHSYFFLSCKNYHYKFRHSFLKITAAIMLIINSAQQPEIARPYKPISLLKIKIKGISRIALRTIEKINAYFPIPKD